MSLFRSPCRTDSSHPAPGCANLLLPVYQDALSAIASYTYRSLLAGERSPELSILFDQFATDSLRHYQKIRELILSLGGNPIVYTPLNAESAESPAQETDRELLTRFLQESIREEQCSIARYETLIEAAIDSSVRSTFTHILREKRSHLHRLIEAC